MHIMRSRRDFLSILSAATAASALGARASQADEAPPEVTTIRLGWYPNICGAPVDIPRTCSGRKGSQTSATCRTCRSTR
jgi:hypothetical protein